MATIEIRHIRRSTGRDRERSEIAGAISVTGREAGVPAGSFGLRHVDSIHLTSANASNKRGLIGSVATPLGAYNNSVRLNVIITGTIGSRTTSIASIGSPAGAGTATSGYFIAMGHG